MGQLSVIVLIIFIFRLIAMALYYTAMLISKKRTKERLKKNITVELPLNILIFGGIQLIIYLVSLIVY